MAFSLVNHLSSYMFHPSPDSLTNQRLSEINAIIIVFFLVITKIFYGIFIIYEPVFGSFLLFNFLIDSALTF